MWTVPSPRAFRNLLEKLGRLPLGMSGSNCTDIGIQVQVSSSKCSGMDMKQPSLPKPSWRLHGGFLKALGCLLRALGWLLGGSLEALGRLLEASKRHLGPKTVIASIFGRFLKKIGNFGRPSWRRFNIKNSVFKSSKRVSNMKQILKAFGHLF